MDRYPSRSERRAVELSGYALLGDGSRIDVALVDLSYEGCRIRCTRSLEPGEIIKLAVFHMGLIDAEVRWSEGGEAGLVFEPTDTAETKHWPRRSQRVPVTATVTMRKQGKPNFEVSVIDMSPEGCKVEFVDRPAVGDLMFIRFDGLETLEAEVCWVEKPAMGLNFAKTIHPAVFDMLMQRLGVDE